MSSEAYPPSAVEGGEGRWWLRRLVSGIISQVSLTQPCDDQLHPPQWLQRFYPGWLRSQSLFSCHRISAPLRMDLSFLHQVPTDPGPEFLLVFVTVSCFWFCHPWCAGTNLNLTTGRRHCPSSTHQGCACLCGPFGPKGNKNREGSRLTVSLDLVDLSSSFSFAIS